MSLSCLNICVINRALTQSEQEALESQLAKVLDSDYFRHSQRCSRFLEYSIHFLIRHEPREELKERRIGIDVFHRPADYDTARDNIVRVTANEVRKRLAQYYAASEETDPLILELLPGTYAVSFRPGKPEISRAIPMLEQVEPATTGVRAKRWLIVAALAICSSGICLHLWNLRHSALAEFWAPLTLHGKTVLISVAQPTAYEPASGSTQTLTPNDRMVPLRNALVGTGDAFALADIARYLSTSHIEWQMVASNDLPSQDLRTGPVVLIGVHSNLWTTRMMAGLHYTFGANNSVLEEGKVVSKWSLPTLSPDWQTTEDYAIVSRFKNRQTGQIILVLAGLTNSGTQAAGEFVTSNDLLSEALRAAPKGWQNGNVQLVLHTRLIGRTPDRPSVVASYFW